MVSPEKFEGLSDVAQAVTSRAALHIADIRCRDVQMLREFAERYVRGFPSLSHLSAYFSPLVSDRSGLLDLHFFETFQAQCEVHGANQLPRHNAHSRGPSDDWRPARAWLVCFCGHVSPRLFAVSSSAVAGLLRATAPSHRALCLRISSASDSVPRKKNVPYPPPTVITHSEPVATAQQLCRCLVFDVFFVLFMMIGFLGRAVADLHVRPRQRAVRRVLDCPSYVAFLPRH